MFSPPEGIHCSNILLNDRRPGLRGNATLRKTQKNPPDLDPQMDLLGSKTSAPGDLYVSKHSVMGNHYVVNISVTADDCNSKVRRLYSKLLT